LVVETPTHGWEVKSQKHCHWALKAVIQSWCTEQQTKVRGTLCTRQWVPQSSENGSKETEVEGKSGW
jgi:hypothetical protein